MLNGILLLTYRENKSGPNIEPCGTPNVTGDQKQVPNR